MNKIDFQKRLISYGVFSLENIYKSFPDFHINKLAGGRKMVF